MDKILNYIFVSIIFILMFNEIINYLNKDDILTFKNKEEVEVQIEVQEVEETEDEKEAEKDAVKNQNNTKSDDAIEQDVRQELQREEITYENPQPWNKIILNQGNVNLYFLEIKNLFNHTDTFKHWVNILGENINISENYLIISSIDDQTALALANLVTMSFLGDISFDEISSSNLIQVSIQKAQRFEQISQKLVELIISNIDRLNSQRKESFNANTLEAYGGNEYTFL